MGWEEDYYYSGRTFLFPPDNGTEWENVIVHFDYPSKLFTLTYIGLDGSILSLFGQSGPNATTNKIGIADTILKNGVCRGFDLRNGSGT